MPSAKLSFSLPEETLLALSKQTERLAAEYKAAAEDIQMTNCELEGTIADGLD